MQNKIKMNDIGHCGLMYQAVLQVQKDKLNGHSKRARIKNGKNTL